MDDVAVNAQSRLTPLAIVFAIILVIPCFFIAGIVVVIYSFFTEISMSRYGDGVSWIPFLSGFFHVLWTVIFPEAIRGFVAALSALSATFFLFKRANKETVTYSVMTVYLLIAAATIALSLLQRGRTVDVLGIAGLAAGMVFGAGMALGVIR